MPGSDDAGCRHGCTEQRRRKAIALNVMNRHLEDIVVRDRADALRVGDRGAGDCGDVDKEVLGGLDQRAIDDDRERIRIRSCRDRLACQCVGFRQMNANRPEPTGAM